MKPLPLGVTLPRLKWSLGFKNLTRIVGLTLSFLFLPQQISAGAAGFNQDGGVASSTRQTLKASRAVLEVKVPSFSTVGQTIIIKARDNQYYSLTLVNRSDMSINFDNLMGSLSMQNGGYAVVTAGGQHVLALTTKGLTQNSFNQEDPEKGTCCVTPNGLIRLYPFEGAWILEITSRRGKSQKLVSTATEDQQVELVTLSYGKNSTQVALKITDKTGSQMCYEVFNVDHKNNSATHRQFFPEDGWKESVDERTNIMTLKNGEHKVDLGHKTPRKVFNFRSEININGLSEWTNGPFELTIALPPNISERATGFVLTGVIQFQVSSVSKGEVLAQVVKFSLNVSNNNQENLVITQDGENWWVSLYGEGNASGKFDVESWAFKEIHSVLGVLQTEVVGEYFSSPEDFEKKLKEKFMDYEVAIEKKVEGEDYVFYTIVIRNPTSSEAFSYEIGFYSTDEGWLAGDISPNKNN